MNKNQMLGIGAFLAGAALLIFAHNAADAPTERVSEILTGQYSDTVMLYIAAGTMAMVGGGIAAVFGGSAVRS